MINFTIPLIKREQLTLGFKDLVIEVNNAIVPQFTDTVKKLLDSGRPVLKTRLMLRFVALYAMYQDIYHDILRKAFEHLPFGEVKDVHSYIPGTLKCNIKISGAKVYLDWSYYTYKTIYNWGEGPTDVSWMAGDDEELCQYSIHIATVNKKEKDLFLEVVQESALSLEDEA